MDVVPVHDAPRRSPDSFLSGLAALPNSGPAPPVEASLSFLGLGTPLPKPPWGAMLAGAGRRFMEVAPWLAIVPGLAISTVVLAFNLLGTPSQHMVDVDGSLSLAQEPRADGRPIALTGYGQIRRTSSYAPDEPRMPAVWLRVVSASTLHSGPGCVGSVSLGR